MELRRGYKVARPPKEELAADIAALLNVNAPNVSAGSSVESRFLDTIHEALTGTPAGGADTYRKTERVLEALGLTYDPYWDTSESAPTGGGTVTTRAYSRVRSALAGIPRCFIINSTDAPVGAKYESDPQRSYGYDSRVSGRRAFTEAGPGSKVVIYSTAKSSRDPQHYIAHATVQYIDPGWSGPWEATLTGYTPFLNPVPRSAIEIVGLNPQNAINEISWDTYATIVEAGAGASPTAEVDTDFGADTTADRIIHDNPLLPGREVAPEVDVPADLPTGELPDRPIPSQDYTENDGAIEPTGTHTSPTRKTRNAQRDKLAEERAVEITKTFLAQRGWTLHADMQQAGAGYDLEYGKDARILHVEVKGVQGADLVFNLTPKEWWRARTDENFVVVAVTSVLAPLDYKVNVVTRDAIAAGQRRATGYRVWPSS